MTTQFELWSVAVAVLFVGVSTVLFLLAPGASAPVVPLFLVFAGALYLYWRSQSGR